MRKNAITSIKQIQRERRDVPLLVSDTQPPSITSTKPLARSTVLPDKNSPIRRYLI
jgi:hypothetical protein